MIPTRYAPTLFGFLLSGLMSLIVSGISTFQAVGLAPTLPALWMASWATAWLVAFPVVLIVAPTTRKIVSRVTA